MGSLGPSTQGMRGVGMEHFQQFEMMPRNLSLGFCYLPELSSESENP